MVELERQQNIPDMLLAVLERNKDSLIVWIALIIRRMELPTCTGFRCVWIQAFVFKESLQSAIGDENGPMEMNADPFERTVMRHWSLFAEQFQNKQSKYKTRLLIWFLQRNKRMNLFITSDGELYLYINV